jgi:2-polyprenyl-3-methyl-5-hydroxy-6-metoxy-1,4-benzoquinol methylase
MDANGSPTNRQSAYHIGLASELADVDLNIYETMRFHLSHDLGLNDEESRARAEQERHRSGANDACDSLIASGVKIENADVLDLGAGLGAMSEELILRGARVTSLEPGASSASLTRRRVERHNGQFTLIQCVGEAVPLPDASIDLVVSLQVLEHVTDPKQVLAEVWRVLKPGGHFYLACENYLAFREGHYRVPWLPLLPKSIGSVYLRCIGRSPTFLQESVTYVTYPGVLRQCRKLGFIRQRDVELIEGLRTKRGSKWTALRAMRTIFGNRGPLFLDRSRYIFKFGLYEQFQKPGS